MEQPLDSFDVSMGMLMQCANIMLEELPETDDFLRDGAKARLAEFQAFMRVAAARPGTFNKKLFPLTRAIDDFVASVSKEIHKPIDLESMSDEDMQAELVRREEASASLDQARLAGCALLTHLGKAMLP